MASRRIRPSRSRSAGSIRSSTAGARCPRSSRAASAPIRPQPRPWECELGHCGVDPRRAARARSWSRSPTASSSTSSATPPPAATPAASCASATSTAPWSRRYIHLDTIRASSHAGRRVYAGEPLGTVGRTGVVENFPHLHFALSLRAADGRERYVDPEPFLRIWELRSDPPRATLPPALIALN